MKKWLRLTILTAFIFFAGAFSAHKFYVAIHQINYNKEKKMLEITSRIFVDDLNKALEEKYGRVTYLGDKTESAEDISLMKSYVNEHFKLIVNGKPKSFTFVASELENNVFICYFKCVDIPKVNTLEVHNEILIDYVTEQQNIIQTTIYGKKNSLLLTADEPHGKFAF